MSITWEKWTHIANGVIFGKWKTLPVFAFKKKCHRKIFMSAKIIGKKPVSSSPPYVPLNLGLILIQHTLSLHDKQKHSWKKKKKKTACTQLSADCHSKVCRQVYLSSCSLTVSAISIMTVYDLPVIRNHDINDDNALSPTVDIWLVPNLWEHTHHMTWQMKLTRVTFAKYV